MIKEIKNIYAVVKREVILISHDINLISILLLAPIFYAFFYGSIYYNKVETDVPVVIVDMDHSSTSQKLIRMLDAHQLVKVNDVVPNYSTAKSEIDDESAQGMVFIPKNFEAELKSGQGTDIKIYLNTSRFLVSNDLNKAINEVIATMGAGVRLKYFQAHGYSFDQAKEMIEPLRLDMRPLFNFTESYGDFLIPAILILIIHQTLLIGLSESMAKEHESETLNELYEKSNWSVLATLHGKGLFYTILYSAYALFFFTINFSIFKIGFAGSAFALVVLTILMIVAVTYFSIFISSFFKRKIIALQFLTLTSYPIFLMSGYSWPMESMPLALQIISNFIPITPYLNGFRKIICMGAGWNGVLPQVFQLLIIILIMLCATYFRMRYLLTNKVATKSIHGV
jgi:ABC-2 type transport system permease protein